MQQKLIQIRAEILGSYEKRINDLRQRLTRAKGLAPEAKGEIQKRIKLKKSASSAWKTAIKRLTTCERKPRN